MHKFLRFFFDAMNLSTWIKDEWSYIYDAPYVTENWINPLLRWQPEMQHLIGHLGDNIESRSRTKKTSKVTEPKEFNLTRPKPRAIPVPQPIPSMEKHHGLPVTTYKPPKEMLLLEETKHRNRQKAEELLLTANVEQFKCANTEKSDSTKRVMSEIMKEEENKLSFDAPKAHPVPAVKVDNIPVRLNATAILREGALYQRKVDQELQKIENLMDGACDPSKFVAWQKQMREKDLENQLAELECRRLEGKLSREEAVLARQNLIQENKKKAVLMKEETEELMRQYAENRLQEEKEMRELVEQVAEGHKNTKQARKKLQKYKQQIVQEVAEESRELLRQALEKAEEELRKKFDLICQIRALESIPFIRHKFVDLTQVAGHRVHGEMSLVELRERLFLLSEAQKKEEEEKRDQILLEKQTKEQLLLDKLEQISLHRAALGRAAALKQEEKKANSLLTKTPVKDERIMELQRKLEEKTQERKKQAEILKIKPQKSPAYSMRSGSLKRNLSQENHWSELEDHRERQAQLLKQGILSRGTAQKMTTYQAARDVSSATCMS
ncbi:cilia- and flagella-associated protein 99 isoform X2 [Ambystoma mexicanum]